jgi:hypothetical protein
VEITISDTAIEPILKIIKLLVRGDIKPTPVPPRGRDIIVYDRDAKAFGLPINDQASGLAGIVIHGDVVLLTQGDWSRVGQGIV